MIISFLLAFSLFYYIWFYLHGNRRNIMMVVGHTIIFLGPLIYIDILDGEKYNSYSSDGLLLFSYLGLSNIILMICVDIFSFNCRSNSSLKKESSSWVAFIFIVFLFCFSYIALNLNKLPILSIVSGGEYVRPDIVKTELRGFFTFSMISNFLLPLCFIYVYENRFNRFFVFVSFLFVSFCLVVGGNKGGLFFFIFFCFFFLFGKENKLKGLVLSSFLITLYSLIKISEGADFSFEYVISSMFERLFVVQGMSLPNVLSTYLDGFDFYSMNTNDIKRKVFYDVYGYSPGSMPLYFYIEPLIRFGYLAFFLSVVMFVFLNSVIVNLFSKYNGHAVSWLIYSFQLVVVIAGLTESSFFAFLIIFFALGLYSFLGVKVVHESEQ